MQRKVFGKPLIEQPVIREKLAQMFAGVETLGGNFLGRDGQADYG